MWLLKVSLIILMSLSAFASSCNRKPQGATGERSPVDESFQLLIDGNPTTYIPGQQYNSKLLLFFFLNKI